MKAITTTGDTIELVKDCDCVTHNGPHWLHMNDFDKHRNSEMLERGNYRGHIECELRRLEELEHNMTSRGIVEIVR
jgi:hypothetical protein